MEDVQCKLPRMTWNTCSDGCIGHSLLEKHHQVSTKRNTENCHIQNQKDRKAEDFGFKMSLLFWMLFFDKTLFNEGELEKVWGFWSKELYSHSHALRIPQTNAMQLPPFAHCYTQSCKRSTSPQKRLKHRSSKCLALNLSGYGTKYIYKCSIYISHLLIWTISWWCDLLCTQLSLSCRHDYSLRSGDIQHLFPLIFNGSFFSQVDRTTKTIFSPRNSILWYFLLPHVSQQYQSMLPFQS